MGCVPFAKALKPGNTDACMEEITALVKLHNKALSKVLPKLQSELKGFKYSIADLYTFLSERIDNPSKYGMHFHFYSTRCVSLLLLYFTF